MSKCDHIFKSKGLVAIDRRTDGSLVYNKLRQCSKCKEITLDEEEE